jgi:hypothetical protein
VTSGLNLGAPGIYRSPDRASFAFAPIRLDIAGFVGVALRGPVNEPTRVDSWTDFQRTFGGFEPPEPGGPYRLLPYAVDAFFAQGGTTAYVVRVAPAGPHTGPDPAADAATATFRLGPYQLAAADEGSWGNALSIWLDFVVAASMSLMSTPEGLHLLAGTDVPVGSLLRVHAAGSPAGGILCWVVDLVPPKAPGPSIAVVSPPLPAAVAIDCEVITGTLRVDDGDPTIDRSETLSGLGLHPDHPKFAYAAIADASQLVAPIGVWSERIAPGPLLESVQAVSESDGQDRWNAIDIDSFFEDDPGADPLGEWDRHRGVDSFFHPCDELQQADLTDGPAASEQQINDRARPCSERRDGSDRIGLLCVPDLDWQWQGPPIPPPVTAPRVPTSGEFEPCVTAAAPTATPVDVVMTRLDPRLSDQLDQITRRQQRLVAAADFRRQFVALLDVPNGIPAPAILRWRAQFDSSFAAAYHPWLGVPRPDDPSRPLVDVPPSVFAAAVIADRERRLGVWWGPANELAVGAVAAAASVSDALHSQLHLAGINVYRVDRDGFRLTAARTMSSDPDYRQLSVRRLMTMLELTLQLQAQSLVFEPNTPGLRRTLTFAITQLLRGLQRAGAFAGATDADSYFVRCDDALNPRSSQDLGRLIAEVGVAPASPLEYLVLRITQDSSGRVEVAASGGGGAP